MKKYSIALVLIIMVILILLELIKISKDTNFDVLNFRKETLN